MSQSIRIAMAQINLLVGAVDENARHIIQAVKRARNELHAQVVVFPELALTGYPPEDLLLRPEFHDQVLAALELIKQEVGDIYVVLGYPRQARGGLYNAAAVIHQHAIIATYHKQHLPNYSVFDEKRYFSPGTEACVVDISGQPMGITICEDIWMAQPALQCRQAGAAVILNINASPYHLGKEQEREQVVQLRAQESGVPIVYVNLVGGQDELVFDGQSFVVDANGGVTQRLPGFEELMELVELDCEDEAVVPVSATCHPHYDEVAGAYGALVLGVRDYVDKNQFRGVVLGLSGGIDSALTLAIAVDAIGKDRVEAVMMPSEYTADMSLEDAEEEARLLAVDYQIMPIGKVFHAFLNVLADEFAGTEVDTTEENIQARCRGVLIMAISNKKRKIVLTTGNKSELAVGYATLYGDMAGGFDVLKDVPKTLVYRLANYRNSLSAVIPQRVITRPPSAELAPDQKDQDTLPDYDILDRIIEMYVEQDNSIDEIIKTGIDASVVQKTVRMIDINEYKRRQAPPGVRITQRAFGRDRRYPITSGYSIKARGGK